MNKKRKKPTIDGEQQNATGEGAPPRLQDGLKKMNAWLHANPGFTALAQRFDRLHRRQHRDQLACGALAERTLKLYHRHLNPAKFAQLLTLETGRKYSRTTVNDYRNAYRMYRLLRDKCDGPPPHLEISKLAKAWQAAPGQFGDDDRIELCRRAAENDLTRSQMRDEILRLTTEKARQQLRYDFVPTVQHVRCADGLDLLRECDPESVDVILLDWMYKPYKGGDQQLPQVHLPDDPVAHLIECLPAARAALAPHGAVALFVDHQSDPDDRIASAMRECGLRRMDQYVWNKPAATFSGKTGALFANTHEIVDIYRRADVSSFPGHLQYTPSVSPKWHARSHRTTSERGVHPFEKPVELMKTLISAVTVNGLVVDVFAGSGSAGVAAVELRCGYRGAELVPEYVEIANRRIALGADREQESLQAINAALTGTTAKQQAAITVHLEKAGIKLTQLEDAA